MAVEAKLKEHLVFCRQISVFFKFFVFQIQVICRHLQQSKITVCVLFVVGDG